MELGSTYSTSCNNTYARKCYHPYCKNKENLNVNQDNQEIMGIVKIQTQVSLLSKLPLFPMHFPRDPVFVMLPVHYYVVILLSYQIINSSFFFFFTSLTVK